MMLSMLPSYTGRRLWRCSRMNERIFSGGVFTSSAATSTRGVNTRSTVTSANSSAEWTSSARGPRQLALVGHRFDDVVELILGHGDLRLALGEIREEFSDVRKCLRQRRENAHKKAQGRRRRKGAPFTVALGDALGEHLSGKKHRDRAHDRAKRHPARAPGARNEHRCERSGGDVDDIRADEDRGNCAVKIVLYVKGFLRLLVALIEPRLEPNAADGRGRPSLPRQNTPPCREEKR